jgi:hypothetical protein
VLFQATAKMPLYKPKSAKRKAKEAKYLARRIALSDVDINTVPSHLDDVPQVPNGNRHANMSSNHEENLLFSKGHRTNNRNLAERGITGKTDEEVQAIIDEVVSNGSGAIPSDIKAIPSIKGAKSGYKGVLKVQVEGRWWWVVPYYTDGKQNYDRFTDDDHQNHYDAKFTLDILIEFFFKEYIRFMKILSINEQQQCYAWYELGKNTQDADDTKKNQKQHNENINYLGL